MHYRKVSDSLDFGDVRGYYLRREKVWAVGSVVRASVSHTEGHWFESSTAHHKL